MKQQDSWKAFILDVAQEKKQWGDRLTSTHLTDLTFTVIVRFEIAKDHGMSSKSILYGQDMSLVCLPYLYLYLAFIGHKNYKLVWLSKCSNYAKNLPRIESKGTSSFNSVKSSIFHLFFTFEFNCSLAADTKTHTQWAL